MRLPSTTAILLNGAMALVVVASIATVGRSVLGVDQLTSCRERYSNAVQWSLQRDNGALLSASDLQARLGATDWGLAERVSIVKADNGHDAMLTVDLAAPGVRNNPATSAASAGFMWSPQSIGGVRSACASYSLMFDPQFAFAAGGRLPGLFGGRADESDKATGAFSTHLAWNDDGRLDVLGRTSGSDLRSFRNERRAAELSKGRWVTVDQELILSAPGRSDGTLRVWLDGSLWFESRNLALGSDPETVIHGVFAEFAYARQPAAPASGRVSITPFEFRW